MFAIVSALLGALVAAFRPRASIVVELLVLRQELWLLKRRGPRPRLRPIDRAIPVPDERVRARLGGSAAARPVLGGLHHDDRAAA